MVRQEIPGWMAMRLEAERRLAVIVQSNAADRSKDADGGSTSMLMLSYRFRAVAAYYLHEDVPQWRQLLRQAASLQAEIFRRYASGEPISPSYVSMLAYKELFNALAAGAWDIADELAERMGGRLKIEKQYDHPFDLAMGYALKWFVLADREPMLEWAQKFCAESAKARHGNFQGYAQVFEAILHGDTDAANRGLEVIVAGHQKECKGRGVFRFTEDTVLCVWGVGMANLCRRAGMRVAAVPPLIPGELLENGS